MNVMKSFNKFVKGKHSEALMLIGVVLVVFVAISSYSNKKGLFPESLAAKPQSGDSAVQPLSSVSPASGDDLTADHYAVVPASGGQSASALPPNCAKKTSFDDPKELLPKDSNSAWSKLNPQGSDGLSSAQFLQAGYHIGIDTVGQSLRNANLQLRSEPPNPQLNIGPWNNSTIGPDFNRRPLEIGCGLAA